MREMTTKQIEFVKIKALIYGKSGVGKTSTALTLKPEHTLILSAESGLLPLTGKNFLVKVLETWADLHEVYQQLLSEENQKKYKTVFIDSLTEINEMAKEWIVKKDRPEVKGREIGKIYDDMMTQQDYGLLAVRLTRLIRAFRDLPYHIIVAALEDTVRDERTGMISVVPSLNGKLSLNIGGYFDEVFRMTAKEDGDKVSRSFLTSNLEKAIAKDRSGALDIYEEADWGKIMKKIFAKFGKKEEKQ